MGLDGWRYEVRACGWRALAGPLLALATLGTFAMLMSFQAPREVNPVLSFGLDLLPLVAGIATAGAVSSGDVLELHLSLPTSFRVVALRRLALAIGWPVLLTTAGTLALAMSGRLGWPVLPAADLVSDQLIWFAPLVVLAGCGAALTLLLHGAAAGTAVVGLLWLVQEVMAGFFDEKTPWRRMLWLFFRFHDDLALAWYTNRGLLIAFALILLLVVYWVLSRSEHLLKGEW